MEMTLIRTTEGLTSTQGVLIITNNNKVVFTCETLEPAWKNNERNKSSIPKGRYLTTKRTSEKHRFHILINNVPNRNLILIHAGNHIEQTEGCILVGKRATQQDVYYSRDTLNKIYNLITNGTIINII